MLKTANVLMRYALGRKRLRGQVPRLIVSISFFNFHRIIGWISWKLGDFVNSGELVGGAEQSRAGGRQLPPLADVVGLKGDAIYQNRLPAPAISIAQNPRWVPGKLHIARPPPRYGTGVMFRGLRLAVAYGD